MSCTTSPEHLYVWRVFCGIPYQHHGVHLGDNSVVHFTDPNPTDGRPNPTAHRVIHTDFAEFLKSNQAVDCDTAKREGLVQIVRHRRSLPADQIRQRAIEMVGAGDYHLVWNNCEHFANWCLTGYAESRQVNQALKYSTSVFIKSLACAGGKAGMKRALAGSAALAICRSASSPWTLAADVVQGTTELCASHFELGNSQQRKHVGRGAGALTAALCGLPGGPVGVLSATALWLTSELLGSAGAASIAAAPVQK
jgi:hypothetical protein